MATRKLEVEFVGDTNSLERAFKKSGDAGKGWGGIMKGAGKAAGLGLAGGVAVGAVALKSFVDAAGESEKSTARMKAQLKASGIQYGTHAKEIETVIQKHSALSAFDDEDLQDSFTNIVRATGDVTKAMELNALAMDIARGRGISLEAASKMVTKAANGQETAFARAGVKLKEGATAQEAIAAAQKQFAGQAKAYGETSAGAQERFGVAVENLKEKLGEKLLPIVTSVTEKVADFVTGMSTGEGAGGAFAEKMAAVWEIIKEAFKNGVEFVRGFLKEHADDIDAVKQAFENIGTAVKFVFEEVLMPLLPTVQALVKSTFKQIGGAIDLIVGLLTGDFKRAWDGLKAIVEGAVEKMLAVLKGAWSLFKLAGEALIKAVIEGFKALPGLLVDLGEWVLGLIVDGFKLQAKFLLGLGKWLNDQMDAGLHAVIQSLRDLGGWILDRIVTGLTSLGTKIKDAVTAIKNAIVAAVKEVFKDVITIPLKIKLPSIDLNPFGGAGGGAVGPGAGGPFNNVQSIANASLGWGLSGGRGAGQGYRPGDDGWHGQNRARDISGPPGAMLAFASMLYNTMGSRLLELIHTPLGKGIKNGQPVGLDFPYPWSSHYDHVHVAMARGGNVKRGGWALVGEQGPELAHLPSGTSVFSNQASRGMMGATVLHATLDLGAGIQQRVSIAFDEYGRQVNAAYRAGVAP